MANRVWKYLDGSARRPKLPAEVEQDKDLEKVSAEAREKYEGELEKSKEDELVAVGIIKLSVEEGLRRHIKDVRTPKQMMDRLKKLFQPHKGGFYSTRHHAWHKICSMRQSDCASLSDWGEVVRRGKAQMVEMGEDLPEWQYICAFLHGLSKRFSADVADILNELDQRTEESAGKKPAKEGRSGKAPAKEDISERAHKDEVSFEVVLAAFLEHEREVAQKFQKSQQPLWSVRISYFGED